jgi:hypothetical protein
MALLTMYVVFGTRESANNCVELAICEGKQRQFQRHGMWVNVYCFKRFEPLSRTSSKVPDVREVANILS